MRWTKAERMSAALIAVVLTIGGPVLLVNNVNSFIGIHSNQMVRSR
jgi:hypothetical protein